MLAKVALIHAKAKTLKCQPAQMALDTWRARLQSRCNWARVIPRTTPSQNVTTVGEVADNVAYAISLPLLLITELHALLS